MLYLSCLEPICVFVDESGDPNLSIDKKDVSNFFVMTAIIVEKKSLNDLKEEAHKISKKYYPDSEIKSSKIRDTKKRINLFSEFNNLPYKFYSYVVDKKEIFGVGLTFRQVFYKHIYKMFYQEIYSVYPEIDIIADNIGDRKFMEGFKKYLNNHLDINRDNQIGFFDKFDKKSFRFSDSKEESLIQLADLITGTINKLLNNKFKQDEKVELESFLKGKSINIDVWPHKRNIPEQNYFHESNLDEIIKDISYKKAYEFLEKNIKSPDKELQDATIKFILSRSYFGDDYIYAKSFISYLNNIGFDEIRELRDFQTRIIAILRDNDVIIASSEKGYKLPTSYYDIKNFIESTESKIESMAYRLLKAKKVIKKHTNGKIDILENQRFSNIRELVNKVAGGSYTRVVNRYNRTNLQRYLTFVLSRIRAVVILFKGKLTQRWFKE